MSLTEVNSSAVNISWSRLNSEDVSYRVYHFNPDGQATFSGNSSWGVVRRVNSQTQFQVVAVAIVQEQDIEGQRSELVCIDCDDAANDRSSSGSLVVTVVVPLLLLLALTSTTIAIVIVVVVYR